MRDVNFKNLVMYDRFNLRVEHMIVSPSCCFRLQLWEL